MRLQTAPIALLGALGLKVGGSNPAEFGEQLTPTFNGDDFYGLNWLQQDLATGNLQNSGDELTLTVPANQAWRVHVAGFRASLNAADKIAAFLSFRLNASAVNVPFTADNGSILGIAAAFAGSWALGIRLAPPVLLPPGAIIAATLGTTIGAAARSCSLSVLVEKFST